MKTAAELLKEHERVELLSQLASKVSQLKGMDCHREKLSEEIKELTDKLNDQTK